MLEIIAIVLFIALTLAQLKLFSIDRTLKDIRALLVENPRASPEPYSAEAFAAARKAAERK